MSDLIERQAAIDYVNDVPYVKEHPHIGLLWKAWIEQLPSAQPEKRTEERTETHGMCPEQQWIPCNERLPEYGIAVLTCDDYGECEINHIIDEDDGEWFWNDVVAWMPLPEPYKEEDNERA